MKQKKLIKLESFKNENLSDKQSFALWAGAYRKWTWHSRTSQKTSGENGIDEIAGYDAFSDDGIMR